MKKAIIYLIVIFGITAGIWYFVIKAVDDEVAKVIAMPYGETSRELPLNSLEITVNRRSAYIVDKEIFGEQKVADRKTVKLGKVLDNGNVEILEGLEDDNDVIVRTSQYLKNRMSIEVLEDKNAKL